MTTRLRSASNVAVSPYIAGGKPNPGSSTSTGPDPLSIGTGSGTSLEFDTGTSAAPHARAPSAKVDSHGGRVSRTSDVELGIVTPVLRLWPRAHGRWEPDGTIDDVVAIAVAADALGYHHLTCSEHVGIPRPIAEVRGGRYWDPLATFGFLAAHTTRIRFATHVLVLGYHHPLEIAKRYGTLDRVSGGRLVLGVGVGSLEREVDLLGAPFTGRGERADDALRALRASMGTREVEYHGTHYDYADLL